MTLSCEAGLICGGLAALVPFRISEYESHFLPFCLNTLFLSFNTKQAARYKLSRFTRDMSQEI